MNVSAKTHSTLRRLFYLRGFSIVGQVLVISAAVMMFETPLPLVAMSGVILVQAAINLRTWLRLRKAEAVSEKELFFELLADVAALTALLYLSGGSTNAFFSLYLLPLIIAATALGARYA
jgi:two-component system, sensor histidine kinase RegB